MQLFCFTYAGGTAAFFNQLEAACANMVNNVFLVTFPAVDSVAIQSGIYDPAARKIYVMLFRIWWQIHMYS